MLREEEIDRGFYELVATFPGGEQIKQCIQCGNCTGSCPVSSRMQYTPRKIIEMVRAGMRKEVLGSDSIWYCTSCYSCSVRCPRGVKLTDVMYALRCIAIIGEEKGKSSIFYNTFKEIIRRFGRMHEPALMMHYQLKTAPLELLGLLPLGAKMLFKGKVQLKADRIRGLEEIEKLYRFSNRARLKN